MFETILEPFVGDFINHIADDPPKLFNKNNNNQMTVNIWNIFSELQMKH